MRRNSIKAISLRIAAVLLMAIMTAAGITFPAIPEAHAESYTASAKIKSNDVVIRKSASESSEMVASVKKNTSVTISAEVFTNKSSTSAEKRWYKVTVGKNTGYVRSDLVKNISWNKTTAYTKDALNYRKGPATTFAVIGTVNEGTEIKLLLPAGRSVSSTGWYRAIVNGETAYVSGTYVTTNKAAVNIPVTVDLTGRTSLAKKLLSNPTSGGGTRVVYTFTKKNCKKKFSVKGYKGNIVPQGMTFTGSRYYIVFGMSDGQSMVTYSKHGIRLKAKKFPFNMGHPNAITWDPETKLCYIFRGSQKKIYTWDPATNKFGTSKTPYSSSGLSYDKSTGLIYATSLTGIRVYTADGEFTQLKFFNRCKHSGTHYVQDCGAGEGFIFHAVSGSNKHTTNYLDIYRVADGKYLGTIKVNLGETESAIVNSKGYVELLINHKGTDKEYIWTTPLNVNDLK